MRIACKVTLLVLAIPVLMGADVVYRWIDEDGVVNYTQLHPRGVKAQQIITLDNAPSVISEVDPVTESVREPPSLSEEQQAMLDELKAAELERQQEVAENRQINCGRARQVLTKLTLKSHIRVRDSTGAQRIIGEDERQGHIENARQGIANNCDTSNGG